MAGFMDIQPKSLTLFMLASVLMQPLP